MSKEEVKQYNYKVNCWWEQELDSQERSYIWAMFKNMREHKEFQEKYPTVYAKGKEEKE